MLVDIVHICKIFLGFFKIFKNIKSLRGKKKETKKLFQENFPLSYSIFSF